ncbi:MAG: hypothetical protein C4288_02150 [Leptolyngbya sp. ERB_1_1]
MAAWAEYTLAQFPQWFTPIAGEVTRHNIIGLQQIAGETDDLKLIAETGEVIISRSGRFILCGSTYVQGSIEAGDPNFTIDVMGAIVVRIPPDPVPSVGIRTHELRLGQQVIPLTAGGEMQDSGFSFSGCTALMLPAETKISLRVGIFADNLTQGTFLNWQARADSALGGANLSIHEIS